MVFMRSQRLGKVRLVSTSTEADGKAAMGITFYLAVCGEARRWVGRGCVTVPPRATQRETR